MIRKAVDFPQPLGPTIEQNSPAATLKDRPSMTTVSSLFLAGKLMPTDRTSM